MSRLPLVPDSELGEFFRERIDQEFVDRLLAAFTPAEILELGMALDTGEAEEGRSTCA